MPFTARDDEVGVVIFVQVDIPTVVNSTSWAQVKSCLRAP